MGGKKVGLKEATSIVIANMVGTGVFTSLGFQLFGLTEPFTIFSLWLLGGIIALCGAFTYAEIGSYYTDSGGEYNYLSKIYHPSIGFSSGWVSSLVGFSAPIALASFALGKYASNIINVDSKSIAILVVLLISLLHGINAKSGYRFQNVFTWLKVALIIVFIIAGLIFTKQSYLFFNDLRASLIEYKSSAFWISLMYVLYSYSGWNAASYISGEIENPSKNLPKSLITGTILVTILYVSINMIFLYSAPQTALKGNIEIGNISAEYIFGHLGGLIMSGVISLLLVSTISAMIIAGPRITASIGKDLKSLHFLGKTNKNDSPYIAILLQSSITIVLILTSSFQSVLTYIGFTLNLYSLATVIGVFVLRSRKDYYPKFKMGFYPILPIIYTLMIVFTLYNVLMEHPKESFIGLGTSIFGVILYFVLKKFQLEKE